MVSNFNISVNEKALKELEKIENPVECGSLLTLQGLKDTLEVIEEFYDGSVIPYKALYDALKTLIITGSKEDGKEIRKGLLSGTVVPKRMNVIQKYTLSTNCKGQVHSGTREEISKYAQNHTVAEIVEKFSFSNPHAARTFLNYHGIPFIKSFHIKFDKEKITEMAKTMTLSELARICVTSPSSMLRFLKREKIEYLRGRRK